MNFEKFVLSPEPNWGQRRPRIRAGVILAASLGGGVAVAVAAAAAFGPFASLRPSSTAHLVHSTKSLHVISAQSLFPKPGPVVHTMPMLYGVHSVAPARRRSSPPTVIDDLQVKAQAHLPVPMRVDTGDNAGPPDR